MRSLHPRTWPRQGLSSDRISLLPCEIRELTATYRAAQPEPVRVDIAGWNVDHMATGCADRFAVAGVDLAHSIPYMGQQEVNWNSSEEQACIIDTVLDAG